MYPHIYLVRIGYRRCMVVLGTYDAFNVATTKIKRYGSFQDEATQNE